MKQSSAGTLVVAGLAFLLLLVMTPVILFMGGSSEDDNTTYSAQGCSPTGDGGVTIPSEYLPYVEDAAQESDLPVSLLGALYYTESGFDPEAVSPVGAGGFAQFMPKTWAEWGNGKDRFDAQASIEASGRYLGHLQEMLAPPCNHRSRAHRVDLGCIQRWTRQRTAIWWHPPICGNSSLCSK